MNKRDILNQLTPFNDEIRVFVKRSEHGNSLLQPLVLRYEVKSGVLRLVDGSILEDGEGYLVMEVA